MKHLILITMLIPTLAFANTIPTRSVKPIVHIQDNVLYLSDTQGSRWAIETKCEIDPKEITLFKIRSKVIKIGKTIQLNEDKICKIESVKLV